MLLGRTMSSWYLVQFKRNLHKQAERNLRQQKFKTFLPLKDFTSKHGSRFLTKKKPLFPGYMFVRADLNGEPLHKINSTRGVSRLICQDGIPKTVPKEIVSALMSRCDSFGILLPPKSLKHGDTIALISGALANFVATVETIDSKKRIWVLIDLMGQATRVQLNSKDLISLN